MAIAFDSNVITLKKLHLNSLKGKKFEILAARGKLRNYKKEVNVFSCYIPSKYNKAETTEFLDVLSNAITEAKMSSEGWFLLGGDWNHRPLNAILDLYPDLKQILSPPTRKNNLLDIIYSNISPYTKTVGVCSPLEGEFGQKLDHKIVIVEALLPRSKAFSWETHEYLEITKRGKENFIELLNKEEWASVYENWPDTNKMTEEFHKILEAHLHS